MPVMPDWKLHNTTKEREWWQERKIDPLMIAGTLWRESQMHSADSAQAADKEPIQPLPDAQQNRARRDCTRDPNRSPTPPSLAMGKFGLVSRTYFANRTSWDPE
jgi:hypothetical protein